MVIYQSILIKTQSPDRTYSILQCCAHASTFACVGRELLNAPPVQPPEHAAIVDDATKLTEMIDAGGGDADSAATSILIAFISPAGGKYARLCLAHGATDASIWRRGGGKGALATLW